MYGNVFVFDERDCTVQRNHQKLIEITPSPWPRYTEALRKELKGYAEKLVKAVGYHSLATVEFLVDKDCRPYLIEANTRLQVEHGITECRYGIDLVEEQIAISFGSKLRFTEQNTKPYLHAMRISDISDVDDQGFITVRYSVDSETASHKVKVREAAGSDRDALEMADPKNVYHIGSPSNGDLWVMAFYGKHIIYRTTDLRATSTATCSAACSSSSTSPTPCWASAASPATSMTGSWRPSSWRAASSAARICSSCRANR